jgi:hypothetical protein
MGAKARRRNWNNVRNQAYRGAGATSHQALYHARCIEQAKETDGGAEKRQAGPPYQQY